MFDNLVILFRYNKDGMEKETSFNKEYSDDDFKATLQLEDGTGMKHLRLAVEPSGELRISDIRICCSYKFDRTCKILMNGYQSWSKTCEYFADDVMEDRSPIAAPLMKTIHLDKYADYAFYQYSGKKGEFHGYTYGYVRNGQNFSLFGSVSEKNGFTIMECNASEGSLHFVKDCTDLRIDSPYEAFDLVWAEGDESFVFDTYFNAIGLQAADTSPINGWTSWYNYYQKISESIILDNLEQIKKAEGTPGIFQIDDGWQTAIGDWLSIHPKKFPNGMKPVCNSIKESGMKAGIWLAPFVCEKHSRIFREKKHWLLKDEKGRPIPAGFNWSGFYALDFYHPEVREYLRKVFSIVFDKWGYDLVKLDFLYAVCMVPQKNKTRGTVMTEAMQFLRECAKDKLILGCGVPLGPSFGLVDYCRIGCDVGLDWDSTPLMRLMIRERVSTRNAILDTVNRRQLNGRVFQNDPDVFLLRDRHIKMNELQKRTLYFVNLLFGSVFFTSDNTAEYDPVKWELFNLTGRSLKRNITKVEQYGNGLIEVFYEEEGEKMLALVHLGGKKLEYVGGPALGWEMIPGYEAKHGNRDYDGFPPANAIAKYEKIASPPARNGLVELKPCETRLFRLK